MREHFTAVYKVSKWNIFYETLALVLVFVPNIAFNFAFHKPNQNPISSLRTKYYIEIEKSQTISIGLYFIYKFIYYIHKWTQIFLYNTSTENFFIEILRIFYDKGWDITYFICKLRLLTQFSHFIIFSIEL